MTLEWKVQQNALFQNAGSLNVNNLIIIIIIIISVTALTWPKFELVHLSIF